jgi:hypothetical protein
MGLFSGLTSVFLIFLSLETAQAEKKHRKKEGSLPPLSVIKPKVPGEKPFSQSIAPRLQAGVAGQTPASTHPTQPVECTSPLPLENLFEQPLVHSPALAAQGAYYLSEGQVKFQASRESLPKTLYSFESASQFRTTRLKFLPTLQQGGTWLYWTTPSSAPSALKATSALAAPSESWVAVYEKEKAKLSRWDFSSQSTKDLAQLEGDYAIRAISTDEKSIALVSGGETKSSQLVVWRNGLHNLGALSPGSEVAFTGDGTGVFFLRPGYQDQKQLIFASLNGKRTRPLTSEPSGIDAFGLSRDGAKIVLTTYKSASSVFKGWKLSKSGSILKPLRLPEVYGSVEGAPAVLDEGESGSVKFFFVFSADTLPSGLWFWDSERAIPWTLSDSVLNASACGASALSMGTGGVVFPPPDPENAAWVVYPSIRFTKGFNPTIQYLHRRGFGVLVPEPLSKAEALNWLTTHYGVSSEKLFEFRESETSLLAARKAAEAFDLKLQELRKTSPLKIQ